MVFPEIGAALTTLKAIAAVAKEAGRIDLTNDVLALQQSMLEALAENTRLTSDNAVLAQKVQALQARARLRESMRFDQNVYWRTAEGGAREGPFCPKCLDGSDRPVRMQELREAMHWHCPVCSIYTDMPGASSRHSRVDEDYHPHRRL